MHPTICRKCNADYRIAPRSSCIMVQMKRAVLAMDWMGMLVIGLAAFIVLVVVEKKGKR